MQADLEYLVERATFLRNRSETSITLAMNVASIGEARRGLQQNKAMFRFTVLVSIYMLFSFTASFFGMNFRQLGQGDLSMWIYVAVSVPVFALSILFLFPDLGTFPSMIRQMRGRHWLLRNVRLLVMANSSACITSNPLEINVWKRFSFGLIEDLLRPARNSRFLFPLPEWQRKRLTWSIQFQPVRLDNTLFEDPNPGFDRA